MGTPPIQIAIAGQDLTGPAFTSAAAKAQAFEAATTGSMRSSMGAARLLNAELDLGLNRTLVSILGRSQLLGSALSGAFYVTAAIGFASVVKDVFDKLTGVAEIEKKIAASKEWEQHVRKVHEQIIELNRELQLSGLSEEQQHAARARWMAEDLGQQGRFAAQLKAEIAALDDRDRLQNKQVGTAFGRGAGTGTAVYADVGGLNDEEVKHREDLVKQLHDLEVDMSLKSAQARKQGVDAVVAGNKELHAELKEINKQADEFWKSWQKLNDELDKSIEKLDSTAFHDIGTRMEAQRKQLAPWIDQEPGRPPATSNSTQQSEMYRIQNDLNYSYEQAAKVLDSAKTAQQKYSDEMERWVEIANATKMSADDFAKGAKKIGEELDKNTNKAMAEFGKQTGEALKQGLLMGRSWQDMMKSLLVTVAELIIKMTVLKALQNSSFGASGFGSILTSVVKGFAGGHASGGYIPPGQWGIVGEQGPEAAFGGASGLSITPNGALGGGGNHFYLTGCVVTDDLVRKAELAGAMSVTEKRAIAGSLSASQERDLRRPWTR